MTISFVIPGPPVPKARPRFNRRSRRPARTPERTKVFEQRAMTYAREAWPRRAVAGSVSVRIRFFVPDARRRDVDNLAKGVLDSLNGIIWRDDSQVTGMELLKAIDRENPRTEVEVVIQEG